MANQIGFGANEDAQREMIQAMTGRPTLPANFATSAFPRPQQPRPQQPRPQGGPGSPASGGMPSGTPSAMPDLTRPGDVSGMLSQAMNQIGNIANQVGRDQGPVQGFGGLAAALNAPRDEPPPLPQLQPVNTPLNLAEQPMPDANLESAAGFGGQADARLNPRPANPLLAALGGGGNRPAQSGGLFGGPAGQHNPFAGQQEANTPQAWGAANDRIRALMASQGRIDEREEERRIQARLLSMGIDESQPRPQPRTLANGPSQFRPMPSGQYLFR